MLNVCRGVLLAAALAGVALIFSGSRLEAQGGGGGGGKAEKITTVDGVDLHAMFFQSPKAKAPTVILLHEIGDSGLKKSYTALAEALQPEYSVMTFDFRGHGKSKDIDPAKFWAVQANQKLVKGASPKKSTIELADFHKEYYSILVNDIAAVKAYLDRNHNDAGDCNTSNTILIGAERGATLGAIWLNSQWSLQRMIPNPQNPMFPPIAAPDPEGKDVIACIWLTIAPKIGGTTAVNLGKTLDAAVKQNGCPTVFMYGDNDKSGRDLAHNLTKQLKVADSPKHKYVVAYEVKGTKLPGIGLVQKALPTEKEIQDYLEQVVDKRGREWTKRDFRTSPYNWRMGTNWVPAKGLGDPTNLMFDTYHRFMGP
jgi:pimeloyl-ACP methyl ester carboxylesterase